ncbi:tyrosine-type recombinase/integrase [Streptosporangium sp. V21-05]|uniref:tyrosine-type recombinase/integrase n=1 Tax=Streptosporangium sp. V21-05 TaxID=3446115 RepID=UPI003F52F268
MFADYETNVSRPGTPLAPRTITAYLSRIRQYLVWLDAAALDGDPLTDPVARDWAARDYRAYLMTVAKRAPWTVNGHLTAVDDFNRRMGVGPAAAKRTDLPQLAPRALDDRAQTRFLREAERAPTRDRALAYTGFYAGLRIAELAALDMDDVHLSARKGTLIVRYGKGGKYRSVPIHPQLRTALETWMAQRVATAGEVALFVNARGRRLSSRGIYDVLTGLADAAGVEDFTPHVLRHTLGTNLRRQGEDIVVIAELLGHSIETARRYTLPSEDERRAAIENLPTDE